VNDPMPCRGECRSTKTKNPFSFGMA